MWLLFYDLNNLSLSVDPCTEECKIDVWHYVHQGSCWKDLARVEFTFSRGFGHFSEAAFTMCGNPIKIFSWGNSPQLTFRFAWPAHFNNFCNLGRLISKKGGFIPLLDSHKKGIFPFKRAFLGEIQRPVRRLFNQISSFGLETH